MKSVSTHLLVYIDSILSPSSTEWSDKEHGLWNQMVWMQIHMTLITTYESLSKFLPVFLAESADDNNAFIIIWNKHNNTCKSIIEKVIEEYLAYHKYSINVSLLFLQINYPHFNSPLGWTSFEWFSNDYFHSMLSCKIDQMNSI